MAERKRWIGQSGIELPIERWKRIRKAREWGDNDRKKKGLAPVIRVFKPLDEAIHISIWTDDDCPLVKATKSESKRQCIRCEPIFQKLCIRCGQTKPSPAFNNNKYSSDRKTTYCRDCAHDQCKDLSDRKKMGIPIKKKRQETMVGNHRKICSRCQIEKTIDDFFVKKNSKTGFYCYCKMCSKITRQKSKQKPEVKEKAKITKKIWEAKNQDKLKKQRQRAKAKRKSTAHGYLDFNVVSKMKRSVRRSPNQKGRTEWERSVGYNLDDLKLHLESKFISGMTWALVVSGEIQIDHIIPRSAFYYESIHEQDFKDCWSLQNLQPLWRADNRSKGDIMPDGSFGRRIGEKKRQEYEVRLAQMAAGGSELSLDSV